MEDSRIIRLFWERSEQAVSSLSAKYGNLCKSIACRIVGNEQDAEECVNDSYLAVWNTIPPNKPDSLPAYLGKITRNIALKKYRTNTADKRNSRYDVALDEICECVPGGQDAYEVVAAAELTRYINRFLNTLHKNDRILFVERYWFCREIEEIAGSMHKSSNFVRVKLFRIREQLRNYLEKEGLF